MKSEIGLNDNCNCRIVIDNCVWLRTVALSLQAFQTISIGSTNLYI